MALYDRFVDRLVRKTGMCDTCRWKTVGACVLPRCLKWRDENDRGGEEKEKRLAGPLSRKPASGKTIE